MNLGKCPICKNQKLKGDTFCHVCGHVYGTDIKSLKKKQKELRSKVKNLNTELGSVNLKIAAHEYGDLAEFLVGKYLRSSIQTPDSTSVFVLYVVKTDVTLYGLYIQYNSLRKTVTNVGGEISTYWEGHFNARYSQSLLSGMHECSKERWEEMRKEYYENTAI